MWHNIYVHELHHACTNIHYMLVATLLWFFRGFLRLNLFFVFIGCFLTMHLFLLLLTFLYIFVGKAQISWMLADLDFTIHIHTLLLPNMWLPPLSHFFFSFDIYIYTVYFSLTLSRLENVCGEINHEDLLNKKSFI